MKLTKLNKLDYVESNTNRRFRKLSSELVTLTLMPWTDKYNVDEVNATCTINGTKYSFPYATQNPINFTLPRGSKIYIEFYVKGCECGTYSGLTYTFFNDNWTILPNNVFKIVESGKHSKVYELILLRNISVKPQLTKELHSTCPLGTVGTGILPVYRSHASVNLWINEIDYMDIPQSNVTGEVIDLTNKFVYVSLGDSIGAGHSLRFYNSGTDTQFGIPDEYVPTITKPYTDIEEGCYTDLIAKELISARDDVFVRSFARSGDRVENLLEKLNNENVVYFLENADVVTVCIGANNILIPAMEHFGDYILNGKQMLDRLESDIDNTIIPELETSYETLINTLNSINPNAKYVFTTIYNPYKFLHLDEGEEGFFKGLIELAPTIKLFSKEAGEYIENDLMDSPEVAILFDRVNAMGDWTETQINKINSVLSEKIGNHSNFYLADAKARFDECTSGEEYKHLVNVEVYSGLDFKDMNWGQLYGGEAPAYYWIGLLLQCPTSERLIEKLIDDVINKVILPDTDPHPKKSGHRLIKEAMWNIINQ